MPVTDDVSVFVESHRVKKRGSWLTALLLLLAPNTCCVYVVCVNGVSWIQLHPPTASA